MFVVDLTFDCYQDTTLEKAEQAINRLVNALRFNGQIIGDEFPTVLKDGFFITRVMCPLEDSLHPLHHSPFVKHAVEQLQQAGLLAPKVKVIGQDIHANGADQCQAPSCYILYTTYVHTCSPLYCGDDFQPVPLYNIPAIANGDYKALIKWQEDWQACDQIQINGATRCEFAALEEITSLSSDLSRRGLDLSKRIRYLTQKPVYYYLYRVGGESLAAEKQRKCPKCDGDWALDEPWFGLFDFKCDNCQLVSNISWDFQ
ncbi:Zn-ribbon-containing protein [Pseudoalteromonas luteoviolacea]|uniref:Zn-ribbon-containing protein n=1 Tax=Pseudoalteromonas luteoviolacea H33 TaxID=1365251 RepID=A0A167E2V4_9GAMM|nr:Zn-ribbon-containing protein [Pseudoalteromonas luteoviolacea]KZN49956.1 Zn-ribbon-containing protein [Pseudoalteromonas luteoviolacea H33]KZN79026.1 Zn-ribbon-containing protein [Pseudoalteromonas luteoviolacea H33-S]MBQ4879902.1 Zn-ribbon-containing protein [Pseudoalteromonas luteoviolacea]MBQ4908940.1 Zn-ribbon-containing protein [Pseudoalteromonas luteoviolacea]